MYWQWLKKTFIGKYEFTLYVPLIWLGKFNEFHGYTDWNYYGIEIRNCETGIIFAFVKETGWQLTVKIFGTGCSIRKMEDWEDTIIEEYPLD